MIDLVIEGGVYVILLFTPLAFGGVELWALGVLQILTGLVVAVWAFGRIARGRAADDPPGANPPDAQPLKQRAVATLWVPIGAFVLLVVAQTIPLPPAWVARLAPAVHDLYARSVPGYAVGRDFDAAALVPWLLAGGSADGVARPADEIPRAVVDGAGFPTRASSWRTLSVDPYLTRQSLVTLLCHLGLFAVVASHFRGRARRARLLAVAALSGCAVSLFGIAQKLLWDGRLYWLREGGYEGAFGPFVNRNSYAAFAGTLLPVAAGLALASYHNLRRHGRGRLPQLLLWSFVAVVIAGGVFFSTSRGGILAAGLSMAIIAVGLVYYDRRVGEVAVVAALIIASALLLAFLGPEETVERIATLSEGQSMPSLPNRIGAWSRALDMIPDHLALGTGFGAFRYGFLRYAPPGEGWWQRAHNEYLELLCDTGLAGGVIVLAGLGAFLFLVVRPGRFHERPRRYLYLGALAGVAGLLVHSAVSSNLQVPANGMILAVLGAVLVTLATRDEVAGTEPGNTRASGAEPERGLLSRRLVPAALLVLVALNTASGSARVIASIHEIRARAALTATVPDPALSSLRAATFWQPGDASNYVAIGRLVGQAEANRLPLRALADRAPLERLGFGLAAMARGIALNPADGSAWFKLGNLYRNHRTARLRDGRMRRAAGRAAAAPGEAGAATAAAPGEAGAATAAAPGEARAATAAAEPAAGPGEPPRLDPEERVFVAATLKAAEMEPGAFRYHDALARFFWDRGLAGPAAMHLRDSFALTPRLAAHSLLMDPDLTQGLAGAILEGIERARSNPYVEPVVTARARAEFSERLGRVEEAAQAFEDLRRLGGRAAAAECDLAMGRLEQRQGRFRESLAPLQLVIDREPHGDFALPARYYLGRAHSRLNEHRRAVDHFRLYHAGRPDSLSGFHGLAGELEALGEDEEAGRLYMEAVSRLPDQPGAYLRAIRWLRKRGRAEEALALARRLARLDPGDEAAEKLIEEIEKTRETR